MNILIHTHSLSLSLTHSMSKDLDAKIRSVALACLRAMMRLAEAEQLDGNPTDYLQSVVYVNASVQDESSGTYAYLYPCAMAIHTCMCYGNTYLYSTHNL